ncbi:MAG: RND family transporter [Myxococcota bacterium]
MQNTSRPNLLRRLFSRWGHFVSQSPGLVALASILLTALVISQITALRFDTSFESFLDEEHPTRVTFDRFRDQFGRGEPIVVAVRLPGRVADPVFLEHLAEFHADLEENVLHLDRITSLVNVRATQTDGDELHIGELLEEWPSSAAELDELDHFVRTHKLYENYLIGEAIDSQNAAEAQAGQGDSIGWTAIILESELYDSGVENESAISGFEDDTAELNLAAEPSRRRLNSMDDAEMLVSVRERIEAFRSTGLEIELAGSVVVGEVVSRTIKSDFAKVLGYAALAVFALLYLVFRRVSIAALVLSVVLLSLASCLGLMAFTGFPVGFGTQILPAFLLAAGVGYAVHVATLFRHHLTSNEPGAASPYDPARERRAHSVAVAIDHAGPPILLTALTTMAGLMSFIPSELAPILQLGIFAPIGIGLAALFSLVLLPALLVLLPLDFEGHQSSQKRSRAEQFVTRVGEWAMDRPREILLGLVVLMMISAFGITKLYTSHHPLGWLPEDAEITKATHLIDGELGGANVLELMIESKETGGFQSPEMLSRLDQLEQEIMALDAGNVVVGKVTGLHNVVKEINQALNEDRESEYQIPADARLVAQELILFENSGMDDVEQLVDSTYTTARVSVRVNYRDAFESVPFAERVHHLAEHKMSRLADVELTGIYELRNAVFINLIDSLKTSYSLAILVVGLLMIAMIGDVRIGLVSFLPNMAPIVFAMGMMGFLGIPLGVYTLLVGSIAIGLAVDDTIHMAHSFVRFERDGETPRRAMHRALSTSGVAVLFTSAALICGFLSFGLASLSSLLHFGIVTSISIVAALVADVVLSPALFVWVAERRVRTSGQKNAGTQTQEPIFQSGITQS